MSNDFHLFPDPAGDAGAIDPDIAIASAYLARELSPMQVLAIESRLATDSAFRAAMQPLLDAWSTVVPSLEGGAATRVPDATAGEIDAGWQRYTTGRDATRIPPLPRQPAPKRVHAITARRKSMTRIAAAVALIVVPTFALAEVAVYAANNPGTPGHAFAQSIVPRSLQKAVVLPKQDTIIATQTEGPVARALTLARGQIQRADSIDAAIAIALLPEAAKPDRARIAALAREHHAAFVRGDTAMDYIVMVVDAADKFVWSTVGIGNATIEVAGDMRTSVEREAYNREFAAELASANTSVSLRSTVSPFKNNAPLIIVDGVPTQKGPSDTSLLAGLDVKSIQIIRGAAAAAAYGSRAAGGVILISSKRGQAAGNRAGGLGADTSLARAVARPAVSAADSASTGSYIVGSRIQRDGQAMPANLATGLQAAGNGQSGIQSLPAASVSSVDLYTFGPRELAPQTAHILVVHLTPGSTWKGR
jgi:TonB-dependent SusC/RagA subfamily outer membrane receptor